MGIPPWLSNNNQCKLDYKPYYELYIFSLKKSKINCTILNELTSYLLVFLYF